VLAISGCAAPGPPAVTEYVFDLEAQQGALTRFALGKVRLGYGSNGAQFEWTGTGPERYLLPALRQELESSNLFGADRTAPYALAMTVQSVKQGSSLLGFGTHQVDLVVHYELRDGTGALVYRREIDSTGSDYAIGGGKRAREAKTKAAQQSVSRFVDDLAVRLRATQVASAVAVTTPSSQPKVGPVQSSQTAPTELPPVTLTSLPGTGISFGDYHALIIGNDRYRHLQGLQSAVLDAQGLDEMLRSSYGFETRLLINATREDILTELNNYRQNLTPDDNLLIYYAGHGWVDEEADEGYWLPVDAASDNPVNWVSNASLTATIRAMDAKHVLVVADSCFSGKLTRGINVQLRSQDYLARMAAKRVRTALTSGGLEPVLDAGGVGGHSVFASAFLETLRENNAVMDMSQMFGFIRRQVALEADQIPEYGDIRRAGHQGGDFLFVRVR
jgi:hypothetical protein